MPSYDDNVMRGIIIHAKKLLIMKGLQFAHGKKLNRHAMKKIKGAEDAAQNSLEGVGTTCKITTYGKNGSQIDSYPIFNASSTAANQHCVDLIVTAGTGVYRCTYTCDYPNQ
jgi:hypothetical protein